MSEFNSQLRRSVSRLDVFFFSLLSPGYVQSTHRTPRISAQRSHWSRKRELSEKRACGHQRSNEWETGKCMRMGVVVTFGSRSGTQRPLAAFGSRLLPNRHFRHHHHQCRRFIALFVKDYHHHGRDLSFGAGHSQPKILKAGQRQKKKIWVHKGSTRSTQGIDLPV